MKGCKPKLSIVKGGALPNRCPGPPAWLSENAKREWRRVAPTLHDRNLLGPDTMATLESYCAAYGIVRDSYQTATPAQTSLFGEAAPALSPTQTKIMFAAMREARLLAAELGLTPHRRGMKGEPEGKKSDGWDSDLLA